MGKQPLKRFTIAITGYFGEQRSSEQMRKWIHNNGGIFAYNVSPKITHLVCSKEDFKKNVAMVQKARQLRTVKIVSWDWLEDTLMKEHPMKESEYLMAPLVKCAADNKEKKKAVRKENIRKGMENFEKGCKEFKEDMFSDGYHIYQDCTKFNYDVTLARTNLLVNKNDRFALKLFESHATPKYYACYAKYSSPGHAPTSEMLAPIGSPWETAWDAFQGFFELKTGKKWEERFVRMALGSEAFTYTPPKVGQPRGMFLEI
ncbi:hypothetical protein HO173_010549 [Letharia columbiana]|uniref:BRCT domain-containing protein n=1 Tax=Letharia columbiana TaxID=112416 RepID=A0A8H6FME1_9LECA|nr:uncharacterized protein HO173_010549 [Letharia columbiana]KAF6231217.1 hypothetical protein HO173_010549 [Letharia columbiana]